MEIILYYHYPLCNRTHQNRFDVSIFGSSAVQGHESDNGDMYSSESSWGDIPPLVEGGYAHFWKKANMIFQDLHECYIGFLKFVLWMFIFVFVFFVAFPGFHQTFPSDAV